MDAASVAKALEQALALHRQGNLAGAMDRYVKVLQDDPKNADALYYVAVVAVQDRQYEEGLKLAQRAHAFGPPQARVHNLMGQAQLRLGKDREALECFERAITVDPKFADAHGNRANLLSEMGRLDEAMVGFDNALMLRPSSFEDWCNRGATLLDLGRFDEAVRSCDRALALEPNFMGAHYNRANALRDLGQSEYAAGRASTEHFTGAEAAYGEALRLAPNFHEAMQGRAFMRLARGEWDTGWPDYEARMHVNEPTFPPLEHPRWKGEPLPDARLVLVTEQGLGDTLQMCRFAPLLAARGTDVTILTREGMRPLLAALPGVRVVDSIEDIPQDKPIRWLPIMSVPGAMDVRPDTVPADVPYLATEPTRVSAWAQQIGAAGFKIGINWGSGHWNNRHFVKRNVPLAAFAPLAELPDVRLFSLQKGPAAEQIAQAPFRNRIETVNTDPDPDAAYFLDTAAVMTHLDLVVTCDTSIAHLAGALGRPTFVLLPTVADWRWMLGRDDSPWYPTMRLFRQHQRGDWSEPMARVVQAVRARAYN